MATPEKKGKERHRRLPPATTPEAREDQMVALAMDEAERQIREGTASAMVLTHYLKLGTAKSREELKKLENETALLQARRDQIGSEQRMEELYSEAIRAMREYQGYEEEYDGDR